MRNRCSNRGFVRFLFVPFMTLAGLFVSPGYTFPETATGRTTDKSRDVPTYSFKIVRTYPHDRNAFTQGLALERGILYEGTGLWGKSELRRLELVSGRVLKAVRLPARFFGEGITVHENRVIQLTWKSNIGFVYDSTSLKLIRTFTYPTAGWGLTHDGTRFIMSDGTSKLYFLNLRNFKVMKSVEVEYNDVPISNINELEYVKGEVYANIWKTDRIARIEPATGRIVGWIELNGLSRFNDRGAPIGVLNGIAYDAETDRLYVTGKLWPKIFQIELQN